MVEDAGSRFQGGQQLFEEGRGGGEWHWSQDTFLIDVVVPLVLCQSNYGTVNTLSLPAAFPSNLPAGGLLLKVKSSKTLWLYHRLITNQYPDGRKCKNSLQNLMFHYQTFRLQQLFGKVSALWWLIQFAFFSAIRALLRGRC